jgi:hypothetical protein
MRFLSSKDPLAGELVVRGAHGATNTLLNNLCDEVLHHFLASPHLRKFCYENGVCYPEVQSLTKSMST